MNGVDEERSPKRRFPPDICALLDVAQRAQVLELFVVGRGCGCGSLIVHPAVRPQQPLLVESRATALRKGRNLRVREW